MNKIKEELFRIHGKIVAQFNVNSAPSIRIPLITLHFSILNKDELQDLINWLISKVDEMER